MIPLSVPFRCSGLSEVWSRMMWQGLFCILFRNRGGHLFSSVFREGFFWELKPLFEQLLTMDRVMELWYSNLKSVPLRFVLFPFFNGKRCLNQLANRIHRISCKQKSWFIQSKHSKLSKKSCLKRNCTFLSVFSSSSS